MPLPKSMYSFPCVVDRCGPFTVVERDREPTVGWHHCAAVERLYLLKIHADSSFP